MKLFKGNWIALVILSTDFRPFDDSTSFYTVRVFSTFATDGSAWLPPSSTTKNRRWNYAGCARLIRESKLSCIIHYSRLYLSPSVAPQPRPPPPPPGRLLSRELLEFPLSFSEEEIYRARGIQRWKSPRRAFGDRRSAPGNARDDP